MLDIEHGVEAIGPKVSEIAGMLLPKGYLPIQPSAAEPSTASGTSPSEAARTQPVATPQVPADTASPNPPEFSSRRPASMMGPACALRILAQNSKCHFQSWDDGETDVIYVMF